MANSLDNWPIGIDGNPIPIEEWGRPEEYVKNEKDAYLKFSYHRNILAMSLIALIYFVVKYFHSGLFPIIILILLSIVPFLTIFSTINFYNNWKHHALLLYIDTRPQSAADACFRSFCEYNPNALMMLWKDNPGWIEEFRATTQENAEWCDAHPELFNKNYVIKQIDAMDKM